MRLNLIFRVTLLPYKRFFSEIGVAKLEYKSNGFQSHSYNHSDKGMYVRISSLGPEYEIEETRSQRRRTSPNTATKKGLLLVLARMSPSSRGRESQVEYAS